VRLQPGGQIIAGIPILRGYEQALLPTRDMLAFQAKYNRNLRRQNPDAKLLALMGARFIISEFPVHGPDWTPLPVRQASTLGGPPMLFYENARWRGVMFLEAGPASDVNWPAFRFTSDVPLVLGLEPVHDYQSGRARGEEDPPGDFTNLASVRLDVHPGGWFSGKIDVNSSAALTDEETISLIFSQSAMPGWQLEYSIDGRRGIVEGEPISPFHLKFQIPGKIRKFKLTYIPTAWYTGMCIQIISLFFYLVAVGGMVIVKKQRLRMEEDLGD
jgi:hypothetical protein